MLHTSVAIICFKCFSSFNLLLQQLVRCCCNNMFMVFQLLQPNVAVVVPCCCNNMFMVFQLLQPNVAVVVSVLLHVFYFSFLCCSAGEGGRGRVARRRDSGRKRWGRADGGAAVRGAMGHARRARGAV